MYNSTKEIGICLKNKRKVDFISLYFLSSYRDIYVVCNKSGRHILCTETGENHRLTDSEIDHLLNTNEDVSLLIGDNAVISAFSVTANCIDNAKRACHYLYRTLKDVFYIPSYSIIAYQKDSAQYIVAVLWGKNFESKELSIFNDIVKLRVESHISENYNATISSVSDKGAYLPLPFFRNKNNGTTRNLVMWKTLMPVTDFCGYCFTHRYMNADTAQMVYELACRITPPKKESVAKRAPSSIVSASSASKPSPPRKVSISEGELCLIASQDTPSRRKLLFALLLCFKCYGQYEYGPVRISPRSLSKLCNLSQDTVTSVLDHLIESYVIFKLSKEATIPFVNIILDNYKLRGTIPNGYMLSDFSKEEITSYESKDTIGHELAVDYVANAIGTLNSNELETMYQKVIQSVFTDCNIIRNQKRFSNKEAQAIKARVSALRCDAQKGGGQE